MHSIAANVEIILLFLSEKRFKIVSTPSKVHFLTFSDLCQISDKKYTLFLFTDKNLLTGNECKKHGLGGKLLFIC
jgi:ribosomal protein S8